MVVASQDSYAIPRLPVPNPNGLVIRCRDDPGVFVVEKDRSDVVEMAIEGEEAFSSLVIPDFNFVIVAARDE